MRRINVKANTLSAVPQDAYVELLRDDRSGKDSRPEYAPLNAVLANPGAVTATAGGGTTGLIPSNASFVSITSSVNTKQVSLPSAVAGKTIILLCAANGCELISAVAADKVNNKVVGATNEAALVAGTMYTLVYDGVDNWRMQGLDALGAVETPVVPDTL